MSERRRRDSVFASASGALALVLVLATVGVLVSCASESSRGGAARDADPSGRDTAIAQSTPAATPSVSQVVLDPSIDEVFVPTDELNVDQLTSDGAFRKWASLNGSDRETPPAGVSVQLGRLTLPLGPGRPNQYTAKDQLVWAFSWQQCPPEGIPSPPQSFLQKSCIEWLFLDAMDGAMIDETWQH